VNYHAIYLAFIPGWIASLLGCKVFYTIHSFAEDNPKHGRLLKWAMKLFSLISIWGCGKNIHTISNSKAEVIKRRFGKSSVVIPCGINGVKELAETDILQRFDLLSQSYYLTIGRVDPIKNLDVLVSAFLNRKNKDYHLVIAGNYENNYGDYLRNLAKDDKHIHFVGIVMGNDKETLLKNCFVNCLVSSNEGMPISLLEAMVYAKPCIVTDIPAIREIMKDKWGYWCKVGSHEDIKNQMVELENKYDEALQKAGEMANYVEINHLWDNISVKYCNYVSKL
jgi:glycosyltransferase involved in cell wall biosynthesis